MKSRYFYIYNFEQAKFFINNGLKVIDINKGDKGDVYIQFLRDDDAEKVFSLWMNRKYKR